MKTRTMTNSYHDETFVNDLFNNGKISIDSYFALEWVRENFTPEEVFSDEELNEWALKNAYVQAPF